jgi:hypothetical protein
MEWYFQPYNAKYTDFFSLDSWVEIGSQPSASSLSSINDEIVTTGLRVQHDPRHQRRKRVQRPGAPSKVPLPARTSSLGETSSQEEYDESESESDRVMMSSGEVPLAIGRLPDARPVPRLIAQESSDDENRTAVNYAMNNDICFTPQPNAFSHPPPSTPYGRTASQPVQGSYFPSQRPVSRPATRQSLPAQHEAGRQHLPHNILSPSFNATLQHDEALRASLSTLLSCAAAARGLKGEMKRGQQAVPTTQPRSNRIEPMSFRLLPESALPLAPPQPRNVTQEPTFKPTLRRTSTSTTSNSASAPHLPVVVSPKDVKRKSRPSSKDRSRHAVSSKKLRRSSSVEDDFGVSPTLLTWVVSAGVVVVISALSFSAGYSLGKEAGKLEAGSGVFSGGGALGSAAGDEMLLDCAREAGRSSIGLRRSLARSAVVA